MSEADRALLSQVITDPAHCPTDVLHKCPAKNKQVDVHNLVTLPLLHTDIITIDADDYKKDPRTGKVSKQLKPFKGGRDK